MCANARAEDIQLRNRIKIKDLRDVTRPVICERITLRTSASQQRSRKRKGKLGTAGEGGRVYGERRFA